MANVGGTSLNKRLIIVPKHFIVNQRKNHTPYFKGGGFKKGGFTVKVRNPYTRTNRHNWDSITFT